MGKADVQRPEEALSAGAAKTVSDGEAHSAVAKAVKGSGVVKQRDLSEAPSSQHMARGVVCALVGGVCWGFSGTCAELATDVYGVSVLWLTWLRMLIAGGLLVLVVALRMPGTLSKMLHDRTTMGRMVVFTLFGTVLIQAPYIASVAVNGAGVATVLQATESVMLIAATCVARRRRPSRDQLIAVVLALTSVTLIATKGTFALAMSATGLAWGMLNAFGGAFFAGYPVKLLQKWGSLPVIGLSLLLGSVVLFPLAQPWRPQDVSWDALSVAAVAAVVLVGTLAAFTLFLQGVKDIGSVKTTLLGLSEPVSATLCSWVFLGDVLVPAELVGFALMFAMMVLVTLSGRPRPKAAVDSDPSPAPDER